MTDAKTRLFCILGRPVRHSLSPIMHNAAFKSSGINAIYLAFEPQNIAAAVEGMRELEVGGFNVTMPFKAEIIPLLGRTDPIAAQIGAVNTVVNDKGQLIGYNTDGIGAISSLKKATKIFGKNVLLIGAGGAGKAIAHYLQKEKAKITIADRNMERAVLLANSMGAKYADPQDIKSLDFFDIIINASPAGMEPNSNETPIPPKLLHKGLVVFDIVYDPLETKFLKEAKHRGCKTINGLEMLLEQGYAAFGLFTGKAAPKNAMRKAVIKAMKGK